MKFLLIFGLGVFGLSASADFLPSKKGKHKSPEEHKKLACLERSQKVYNQCMKAKKDGGKVKDSIVSRCFLETKDDRCFEGNFAAARCWIKHGTEDCDADEDVKDKPKKRKSDREGSAETNPSGPVLIFSDEGVAGADRGTAGQ